MKAEKLAKQALFDIGKGTRGNPVKAADGEIVIDSLNSLMFEYADLGLSYTVVESLSDDITTPNWSWRWMRYALALELADQFSDADLDGSIHEKHITAFRNVASSTIDPYWVDADAAVTTEQQSFIVTEDS